MNIDKTQLRKLAEAARARYSDSKKTIYDLELIISNAKLRLESAESRMEEAKNSYVDIVAMLNSIEDNGLNYETE